jgi:hypothetical protein
MSNAASQTFTPSLTGLLTNVYLYCAGTGGAEGTLDLSVEGNEASAQCGITAGWVNVAVGLVQVYAGQQATIVISGSEPSVELAGAAADYAGGKATDASGDPISGISDFAFKTYVITASTTTYEWSVPAVTAGSTSTVTLTASTTFDDLTSNVSSSLRAGSAAPDGGGICRTTSSHWKRCPRGSGRQGYPVRPRSLRAIALSTRSSRAFMSAISTSRFRSWLSSRDRQRRPQQMAVARVPRLARAAASCVATRP